MTEFRRSLPCFGVGSGDETTCSSRQLGLRDHTSGCVCVVIDTEIGDREKRLDVIKELVDQLPEINRRILVLLIEHLYK